MHILACLFKIPLYLLPLEHSFKSLFSFELIVPKVSTEYLTSGPAYKGPFSIAFIIVVVSLIDFVSNLVEVAALAHALVFHEVTNIDPLGCL